MIISDLGHNIKRLREQRGMTALKLSELAGVGNSTISQIESGHRQTLKGDTIEKIAKALNVSVNELMAGESDSTKFETDDLTDILNIISYADFITFEGKPFDHEEKLLFNTAVQLSLDAIRYKRLGDKIKNKIN